MSAPGVRAREQSAHAGGASWLERRARDAMFAALSRLEHGALTVVEGDQTVVFGKREPEALSATLHVNDPCFWTEAVLGGSLGAAESYVRGEWDCNELTALVRLLARQREVLAGLEGGLARWRAPLGRALQAWRRNTPGGSRRNIAAHYDLGNEVFATFLDSRLMYSSALYPRPDAGLEEAARHKLDVIARRLRLEPGMEVVEIGTGWGGFAIHAAREFGCRVVTTTLSREQHREATARVRAAGVADRVDVRLDDYRDLPRALGRRFDRLVSIEMIEAVGPEYLGLYFETLERLLRPDGRALVQAIVIRDQDEAAYRKSPDFIQRYIFPGGSLPSVRGMVDAVARRSGLRVDGLDDWTPHYARTLAHWRERFEAATGQLAALGFDERFRRLWRWYFCYCEGGFLERTCGLVHLHLAGARAGLALEER